MVEPYRSEMRTEAISLCDALSSRASVTRMCTTSRRMFWMLHSASDALREEEVREKERQEGRRKVEGEWRDEGGRSRYGPLHSLLLLHKTCTCISTTQ